MQPALPPQSKQPDKQPDAVSDQLPAGAPSLWLYVSLISLAFLLILISFSIKVDWAALFLNLACSLLAAILLLILVDRRLRASELGRIRRLPREVGFRSLLLVSPRHRHFHAYVQAFLAVLEPRLSHKIVPNDLDALATELQRNSLLIGTPRSGKTTRLQMLARLWANRFLRHETPKAPILFPLRRWPPQIPLDDALYEHVNGFSPIWRWSLRRTLRQGHAVVVLDGFDELSALDCETFLREFARLRAEYPKVTWIVSTQPGAMPGMNELPNVNLSPFSSAQVG